jgi:hypothetical protein
MLGPPAPFDQAVVASVADDNAVAADALRDLLSRHQDLFSVGDRTVEDTVYEWRTGLPEDPEVARTDDAVYLDAPDHAWADLLDWLDLDAGDPEAAALRAAHRRQFAADRGDAPAGAVVVERR